MAKSPKLIFHPCFKTLEIGSARVKEFCLAHGADLAGVANLGLLKERFPTHPPGLLDGYIRGISIGIALDQEIIEGISGGPTATYARHYNEANQRLDALAKDIANWVKDRGYSALAVSASDIVDKNDRRGAVSHRAVGRLAGLGWVGKSLMLVNPDYGPRFRMTTVLTDMPLAPDKPIENRCGNCRLCTDACVAGAVKDTGTDSYYEKRSEAVDMDRCMAVLEEFKAHPEIGSLICGVCVKICPYGKKQDSREDQK